MTLTLKILNKFHTSLENLVENVNYIASEGDLIY